MELLIKEASDRWILKQRSGGKVLAVAKASLPVIPNTLYNLKLEFNGSFEVYVNSTLILSAPIAPGVGNNGTFGLEAKAATPRFADIAVY